MTHTSQRQRIHTCPNVSLPTPKLTILPQPVKPGNWEDGYTIAWQAVHIYPFALFHGGIPLKGSVAPSEPGIWDIGTSAMDDPRRSERSPSAQWEGLYRPGATDLPDPEPR